MVVTSTDTLDNPWAGGLNYAQFSDFDFDQDGDLDLFVFDRSSNNIKVFTQETSTSGPWYKYAHDAQSLFPQDVLYRATLIDYDADGRKDLFTWSVGGLKVYRNVSDSFNGLQWELFQDIVYTDYVLTGLGPLDISADDIPAIVDVDFDGDIDVLTTDPIGRRIEYHQNQSMELYGIPDSLEFVQMNQCWGKFSESPTTNAYFLNDTTYPCVGGDIPFPELPTPEFDAKSGAHTGATILAIDIDSSGVLDLVMGDDSYNSLTLLINGGASVNSDSPMISFDDAFPSYTTPVKCYIFPAAFYLDVDFDGTKDLIATPNSTASSFDEQSVMFYKNIATNGLPTFTPVSLNFLQSEMIEHGTGSIPVVFDYNEDSIPDLLVANFHRYKPVQDKESLVAYYENIGSASSPTIQFVDNDILNLAIESYGLRTVPTFGDIDNDGDEDAFLGLEDGTLVFRENLSMGGGANFAAPQANYTDNLSNIISTGGLCFPQLFDLDNDGLLDLLLGTKEGKIMYYRNIGTATTPSFELTNDNLGDVDPDPQNPNIRIAPHFFRSEGETHLFAGSINGTIMYFDDIDANLGIGNSFNLVSNSFLGIDVGAHSSCYVQDIDQDGNLNMFVGQDLGGLYHYEVNPGSQAGIEEHTYIESVALYPNPADASFTISSTLNMKSVRVIDMAGKLVLDRSPNGSKLSIETAHLNAGIYAVSIELESGNWITKKLVIE